MGNNNELLLDKEGRKYSEKWVKIITYIGILAATGQVIPFCISPKGDLRAIEDYSSFVELVPFIGDIVFTVIEVLLLLLITRKMKIEGIEKPSSTLIYALIGSSILSTFGELLNLDDMIGLVYFVMLWLVGWKFFFNQKTKMIGICMFLLPIGAIITALIADPDNHNKWIAILTAFPYISAAGFYLESCCRFLIGKDWEQEN